MGCLMIPCISDYASVSTDPELLKYFANAPRVNEPNLDSERELAGISAKDYFSKYMSSGTLSKVKLAELISCSVWAFSRGCSDTRVGLYSTFWSNAAYMYVAVLISNSLFDFKISKGYDHPEVERLGFMCVLLFDL